MQAHSASPERWMEPAVSIYAMVLARKQPAQAMEVAQRIEEPKWRDKAISGVARRWLNQAPEAANAWLASAELSPELRAEIERPAMRKRRPSRDDGPIEQEIDDQDAGPPGSDARS
jgi:hypothetical protein